MESPCFTKSKISKLLSLVLVTCGRGIPMVLYGFIPILSSVFRPKSTLILLPLFRLPKGNPQSLCPHISTKALAWLASSMILLPNHALPISIYFDAIVVSDNKRCSILVQLVSAYWSVVDMDICLSLFLSNGFFNDDIIEL